MWLFPPRHSAFILQHLQHLGQKPQHRCKSWANPEANSFCTACGGLGGGKEVT